MYVLTQLNSSTRGHRHTRMCESHATSTPGSLSLYSSLVAEKKTRVAAGHVAPKIWEPPNPPKMQLEQNVKKFKRQKLRKHGFNLYLLCVVIG